MHPRCPAVQASSTGFALAHAHTASMFVHCRAPESVFCERGLRLGRRRDRGRRRRHATDGCTGYAQCRANRVGQEAHEAGALAWRRAVRVVGAHRASPRERAIGRWPARRFTVLLFLFSWYNSVQKGKRAFRATVNGNGDQPVEMVFKVGREQVHEFLESTFVVREAHGSSHGTGAPAGVQVSGAQLVFAAAPLLSHACEEHAPASAFVPRTHRPAPNSLEQDVRTHGRSPCPPGAQALPALQLHPRVEAEFPGGLRAGSADEVHAVLTAYRALLAGARGVRALACVHPRLPPAWCRRGRDSKAATHAPTARPSPGVASFDVYDVVVSGDKVGGRGRR